MASYSFDNLMTDLKKSTYTPKSDQDLQKEATDRYASIYAQKDLAAKQATDTATLALDRQLAGMGTMYGKQKEASQKAYDQTYSQANRQATGRGMQRSSFNNANLGNISIAGNRAQQDISDQEASARMGLMDQQTLLARQLGETQRQNADSRISDTNAYLDQLQDREYTRGQTALDKSNALSQQLYQYSYQNQRDQTADEQWRNQFDEGKRQFDVTQTEGQRQFNENLAENRRQYDTSFREDQRQYDNTFAEGQRQYNTSMDEDRRQFDLNFGEDQRQYNGTMDENRRQFDLNYGENRRQYDTTMRYNYDQLDENRRQYNTTFVENKRQYDNNFGESKRQFDLNFGENRRQYDDTSAYNRETLAENRRQYDGTLTENQRQFDTLHPKKSSKKSSSSSSDKAKAAVMSKALPEKTAVRTASTSPNRYG